MTTKNLTRYTLPRQKWLLVKEPAAKGEDAPTIRTPEDIGSILEPLRYLAEEKFVVILVNAKHTPTAVVEVSHGTLSSSLVHPREVFKSAILSNAHSIVCAHNHPGGSPQASNDDLNTTKQLIAAGNILGINVIDHVIITPDGGVTSIRENYPTLWEND